MSATKLPSTETTDLAKRCAARPVNTVEGTRINTKESQRTNTASTPITSPRTPPETRRKCVRNIYSHNKIAV